MVDFIFITQQEDSVANGLDGLRESSVHSIAEQDIEARLGLSQSYYAFTNSVSLIEQVQKALDLL